MQNNTPLIEACQCRDVFDTMGSSNAKENVTQVTKTARLRGRRRLPAKEMAHTAVHATCDCHEMSHMHTNSRIFKVWAKWRKSRAVFTAHHRLKKRVRTCAKEIGTPAREALFMVRGRRTQSPMYGDGELKVPKI